MSLLPREVAAVFLDTINCYHVVCPLPDTAADELGVLVKEFVVVIHIAGAVAHGVGVFAEEHRHGDIIAGSEMLYLL